MAVYSIKNISASAVVWSSQTIQPNEAIDINYENLYDKTTDLGISQDAINVSALAQEDKILLCIDDSASTKEDTLEFIRELHNKNNVLEIPTKFLPSKHSNKWEHEGDKLFHLENKVGLGTSEPDGKFHIKDGENINLKIGKLEHDNASNLGAGLTFTRTTSNSDLMGLGVIDVDKLSIMSRKGIVFFTGGNSSYKNTQEVMRINELGEICMGDNYLTGAKLLIEEPTNPQLQLKNVNNKWDFRVGDTGDLIFKSSSVEKLRFKTDGTVSTSNGLVVTESPYFTDGWVNVPSSWVSSYVTTAETLQYRVDETGTIEFCGRCYNTNATSSRQFPIINANGLPSYLRPDVKQRGTLACEVSGVTTCLYYYMSTNSQLYIYQDSDSSGTFSAGSCYVAMTTLKYKISG